MKPDSVKLTMGHLLHGEAAPWNRSSQTPVPPWIQGLMRHVSGWSVAVDPLSATAVPLHLTQFAVPFVQIVATVCLQSMWFYTIFLRHMRCMVHGSRALGWLNLLFFGPVVTSPHPAIWLRKIGFTQQPIRTLGWCDMLSQNRAPRVCREPSSSKPLVLSRARFASCTGQIHDTACSTEHVLLHPV